ncbi:DUF4380 domain-containing protein [Streptomyces griseus]|uniref:DUF4380 domain-containing protein n=1 Tax=Streptomyces griseus TaxID=1911 RepID=UPI00083FE073|nr:DUF4380 domain-containing protein [Streptomyces griseus]
MTETNDAVRVRRTPAAHGELITLDAGALTVTAAPGLGGRLLSVTLDGAEFLYRNPRLLGDDLAPLPGVRPGPHDGSMADWLNWGGDKTWPAPQGWDGPGRWAGPPDPVLDSGPYTARVEQRNGTVALVLTSGDDPRTGLRLERRIALRPRSTAFGLHLRMTNTSATERRWALWNVTQIAGAPSAGPAGAEGVYLGRAGSGRPATVPLVAGTGRPRVREAAPGVLHVPHQDVVGKVGFPDSAGWLAHVGPERTLTQRFTVQEVPYPDEGSRAEVWLEYPLAEGLPHLGGLRPLDHVVECEALGPLTTLAPGASALLEVEFGVGPSVGPVEAVTPAGYWAGPPPGGADGRLEGIFVPYAAGRLEARGPAWAQPLVLGALEPGRACRVRLPSDQNRSPVLELTAALADGGTARVALVTAEEDGKRPTFNS